LRTIVAGLWPVDDGATAYLVTQFHKLRTSGTPPAAALPQAQAWLRDRPGWEAPYYWAGFVIIERGSASAGSRSPL
jgi:CHAT domain-containing protein